MVKDFCRKGERFPRRNRSRKGGSAWENWIFSTGWNCRTVPWRYIFIYLTERIRRGMYIKTVVQIENFTHETVPLISQAFFLQWG